MAPHFSFFEGVGPSLPYYRLQICHGRRLPSQAPPIAAATREREREMMMMMMMMMQLEKKERKKERKEERKEGRSGGVP